jgi:hypothetical protein
MHADVLGQETSALSVALSVALSTCAVPSDVIRPPLIKRG